MIPVFKIKIYKDNFFSKLLGLPSSYMLFQNAEILKFNNLTRE